MTKLFSKKNVDGLATAETSYTFGYLIAFYIHYLIEVTWSTDTLHLFLLPSLLNSHPFHTTLTGDPVRQ